LRPIAFVGAGMSQPYYSGWPDLLAKLSLDLGMPLEPALGPLAQAEKFFRASPGPYEASLVASFGAVPLDCRPGLKELVKLNFAGVLTTNYDYSIYRAFVMDPGIDPVCCCYPFLPISYLGRPRHVFFLHGAVQEGRIASLDNFILHETAYLKAYFREGGTDPGPLTLFLFDVFNLYDVLLVGYGLGPEEPVRFALKAAKASLGANKRRIMLVPAPVTEAARDAHQKEWGIELVAYDTLGDHHLGLDELIASLGPTHQINPPKFDSSLKVDASLWRKGS